MLRGISLLLASACATAHVVGPEIFCPKDPQVARTVVVEPFFETAAWETVREYEGAGLHSSRLRVKREWQEKPLFAQVDALAVERRFLVHALKKLRPSWRVSSTSELAGTEGPLTLVRTIIEGHEIVESNRELHNLAFSFGIVLWPLQLININPVSETFRIYGALERYSTDAATAKSRLIRYATQPDAAFNAAGLNPLARQFGLEVMIEEGVAADATPRKAVLIEGFAERLAVAVVAMVEEP
jgi:hypothetical protein